MTRVEKAIDAAEKFPDIQHILIRLREINETDPDFIKQAIETYGVDDTKPAARVLVDFCKLLLYEDGADDV